MRNDSPELFSISIPIHEKASQEEVQARLREARHRLGISLVTHLKYCRHYAIRIEEDWPENGKFDWLGRHEYHLSVSISEIPVEAGMIREYPAFSPGSSSLWSLIVTPAVSIIKTRIEAKIRKWR